MHRRVSIAVSTLLLATCAPQQPERETTGRAELSAPTASMSNGRARPVLVTLVDGRVLAAGDFFGYCEIYDPSLGSWSPTGSMATSRSEHAAALLQDGSVLVAAGVGGPGPTPVAVATAELYDPVTGTWSPTGGLGVARRNPASALLQDGRFLVAGGFAQGGAVPLASAEIYDPATASWTPTGPMTAGVTRLVSLPDGRVVGLAAGRRVQFFDPQATTWTDGGPVPAGQSTTIAALLPDGRVLASGGGDLGTEFGRTSILDPDTLAWSSAGPMQQGRFDAGVSVRPDGAVLALGGLDASGAVLATVERFDPATATWAFTAPLLTGRITPGVAALPDGSLLVAGGRTRVDGTWTTLASAERYDECQPTTCEAAGIQCGTVADGCGGTLECGGCGPGLACAANVCVCAPATCASADAQCGLLPDGCGGTLDCGGCAPWQVCAGNQCVCAPIGCVAAGAQCGQVADGCGGILECGGCADGFRCESGACLEATPPTAYVLAPEAGTIVGGIVQVQVGASDNVAVTRVEVYASTTRIADRAGAGPHLVSWDTSFYSYGTWPLEARAYDAAGNVGRSVAVPVTIVNPYATYDATLKAPRCPVTADCRSGDLLVGRGPVGPERNAPNTIGGTCADGTSGSFHYDESLDRLRIRSLDGTVLAPGKTVEVEAEIWAYNTNDYLEIFSAPNANTPTWTRVATVRAKGTGYNRLTAGFVLPGGALQAVRGRLSYGAPGATGSPCVTAFYADHDDLVFGVQPAPDRTAPSVSITNPANDATLTGPVTVTATASDDVGVVKAELWLDAATRLATWWGTPYSKTWDPRTVEPGLHELTVLAVDAVGNVGTSAAVSVNVVRDVLAPTIAFLVPLDGAVISGNPTVRTSASDDFGVKGVDYYMDGAWIGSSYQPPDYPFYLPTGNWQNGTHTLEARASDVAGNVGIARATVTIANDLAPPSVSVLAPAANATVSGVVSVEAAASDDIGVTKVELLVDGSILATRTAAPYVASWDSTLVANGAHSISARAYDAAGKVATSSGVAVTVANATSPVTAVFDATFLAPRCASATAACDTVDLVTGRASLGPEKNSPNTLFRSCMDGTAGTFHADESLDRLRISTVDGLPFASGKTVRVEATVWVWGYASDALDLYHAADAGNPVWTFLRTIKPAANGQQSLATTYVLPAGSIQAIRGVFRYGGAASPCGAGSYNDRDDLVFPVQ